MKLPKYLVTLLSAILFVALFFEKSLGMNVAIYGICTIALLAIFKTEFFKPMLHKVVSLGFLLTTVFYYLYASPFTLFVAFLSFLLLIGLHTSSSFRNLLLAIPNSFVNYFAAYSDFFESFRGRKKHKLNLGLGRILRIITLPLFIVLLFIAMYSVGSTFFSEVIGDFFSMFDDLFTKIAKYIDIAAVFVGVLGLLFGVLHSLGFRTTSLSELDSKQSDILSRVRSNIRRRFKTMDLSLEYKSGLFLLSTLSLLLAILLFGEIKNIWFNFEWGGELLKELVHEGTYVLIVAILISMAVTMYYFRKNLNFYKSNKPLKTLAYIWIVLNALLVVSVLVRNIYYIQFFGLAYKRIGVMFFLALCVVGLLTIFIKISKVKSSFFVTRVNAFAAYVTLVVICFVNWDGVIAKYNFSHYKTSFVHLPFMSNLSDKTLPYLRLSDTEMEEIESKQVETIPFAKRGYFKDVDYQNKIEHRIEKFKEAQEERHWLESVWAEDKAIELLKVGE
ncbi:MAG: DUF4173 domain-containing protein [Bacteroidia bacterium]